MTDADRYRLCEGPPTADEFVDVDTPSAAYVCLVADVDGFYERFGYEETRPASKGMYRRVD